MNEVHDTQLKDHNYDGIEEYDNPLPGWWSALFALSAVYAVLYIIYFHFGSGTSIHAAYDQEVAEMFTKRFSQIGELEPNRETIEKYMQDPKWLAVGKSVYLGNCVSCHGQNAEGLVGPNLTDDHWKNVKKLEDIASVIENGAANGAMPAWRDRLSHVNQIVLTAAYVASLRGSQPSGGKPPEGETIPPWSNGT